MYIYIRVLIGNIGESFSEINYFETLAIHAIRQIDVDRNIVVNYIYDIWKIFKTDSNTESGYRETPEYKNISLMYMN